MQKAVDAETGICNVKHEFSQKLQGRFDKNRNEWEPEVVELSLLNGDELVGVASFDLTRFIGKGTQKEKITMHADGSKIVMKGNAGMHTDAYIIFSIYANIIKNGKKESPSKVSIIDDTNANNADTTNQSSYDPFSMMGWAFSGQQQNKSITADGPSDDQTEQVEELNQRLEAYKSLLESHDKQVQSLTAEVEALQGKLIETEQSMGS